MEIFQLNLNYKRKKSRHKAPKCALYIRFVARQWGIQSEVHNRMWLFNQTCDRVQRWTGHWKRWDDHRVCRSAYTSIRIGPLCVYKCDIKLRDEWLKHEFMFTSSYLPDAVHSLNILMCSLSFLLTDGHSVSTDLHRHSSVSLSPGLHALKDLCEHGLRCLCPCGGNYGYK